MIPRHHEQQVQDMRKRIKTFQRQCAECEYTDTGEAHELLRFLYLELGRLLSKGKR